MSTKKPRDLADKKGDGMTEDEIAAFFGISRARVSQLLNSAYRKLRRKRNLIELYRG